MSKFLYEIGTNMVGEPYKNKYTVVYENKTYVYCKVNGTDNLLGVKKELIGKVTIPFYGFSSRLYTYGDEYKPVEKYTAEMIDMERKQLYGVLNNMEELMNRFKKRLEKLEARKIITEV